MINNRYLLKIFLLSILLLPFSFLYMSYIGLAQNNNIIDVDIFINDYGIANIIIYTNISIGLNNITLPITPLEASIFVACGGSELPFIYEEPVLYISSGQLCRASISYIADLPCNNGVFNLSISLPSRITLTISDHVLLLTIPNDVISISKKGNSTLLEFFGPTIILYTIMLRTITTSITTQQNLSSKQTLSTSATLSPSSSPITLQTSIIPITATETYIQSVSKSSAQSPMINTSLIYTFQQTSSSITLTRQYPLISISIIAILLIILIVVIVSILMKRK